MRCIISLLVLTVAVTCVHGWGRILADNGLSYSSWIPARRSWGCGRDRDVCYQSAQCCRGYFCANLDPNDRKSSGLCRAWRPSASESCTENSDCQAGYQCAIIGQVGSVKLAKCRKSKPATKLGSMGDDCTDSSDCGTGLCCQTIRAFRRGPVRMCHHIRSTSYSSCINSSENNEN